jgi:hypothetical protein
MNARQPSTFRLLLKLFQNRFLENDGVSPGGGFQINIYQTLGVVAAIGLLIGYYVVMEFMALSLRPSTHETEWAIRDLRLFFCAYAFGVAGFAAVFEWDMLFPDRRDFLILAPFPIPVRELVAAKFAALGLFLLMFAGAVNACSDLMMMLANALAPNLRATGIRLILAQIAATGGASAFAFLAVTAVQGVLINVTPAKIFRRISPWMQMLGLSVMVISTLGFPAYAGLVQSAVEKQQWWLHLFPPAWFGGLYEMILGGGNPTLVSLGTFALEMTGAALLVVALSWGLGYRRHFRRTLETEDAPHHPRRWSVPHWLIGNPNERTLFGFIGKTLARSQKHQFFLAAYLSAGLCVAAFFCVAIRDGRIVLSASGARSAAFVLGFFFISGFRAVFQFPAELSANWIFRLTEAKWTELARSATRKAALAVSLIALLALALPLELEAWHWPIVLEHCAVQIFAAALLVEAMFWNFDKVPFTCSYFPGRASLALLVVLYVYGVTGYSFNMADLEVAMERNAFVAVSFFGVAIAALTIAWRHRPQAESVRFDGSEPEIQQLELN